MHKQLFHYVSVDIKLKGNNVHIHHGKLLKIYKSQIQNDINIMHFLNFINKIIFWLMIILTLPIFFFLIPIVVFIKLNWIKSFWKGLCPFIQYLGSNCFICTKKKNKKIQVSIFKRWIILNETDKTVLIILISLLVVLKIESLHNNILYK